MSDISTSIRTLGRGICVIIGASKGFLAQQMCSLLESGPVLWTLLQELLEKLQSSTSAQQQVVHCTEADLSAKEGLKEKVKAAKKQDMKNVEHVLLINNTASLSSISHFSSFLNTDGMNSYLFLNATSALMLTARILQVFPPRPGLRWTVGNISSAFALQALPSWVLYCIAKAAREKLFRELAVEEPHVKVLSYSPGKNMHFNRSYCQGEW